MSKKSAKIEALIASCRGRAHDAHYLGYFECFNRGLYYEAHDVLEELWLTCRHERVGNYYKALIQLAGGFVHLQKNRLRPAAALFRLSERYLQPYRPACEEVSVESLLETIQCWLERLETGGFKENPLGAHPPPRLALPTTVLP